MNKWNDVQITAKKCQRDAFSSFNGRVWRCITDLQPFSFSLKVFWSFLFSTEILILYWHFSSAPFTGTLESILIKFLLVFYFLLSQVLVQHYYIGLWTGYHTYCFQAWYFCIILQCLPLIPNAVSNYRILICIAVSLHTCLPNCVLDSCFKFFYMNSTSNSCLIVDRSVGQAYVCM